MSHNQSLEDRVAELERLVADLEKTLDEVRLTAGQAYQMANYTDMMTRPIGGR